MYCPTCGQQASEQMKFCSRCGFPLAPVTQLIANTNLMATAQIKAGARKKEMSERRKGIRRGAKIIFFSLALLVPTFGIAIGDDAPELLIFPFTMFMVGLLWMLYSRLFGDDTPIATPQYVPPQMGTVPQRPALPAQYENSVAGLYTPARNTADMMEKPSVTETTTKLLDDN